MRITMTTRQLTSSAAHLPQTMWQTLWRIVWLCIMIVILATTLTTTSAQANSATLDCNTTQYDPYFKKYSARYFGSEYDWRWFKAVAITESGLCKNAVSSQGAQGLMQIMPATYADIRSALPNLHTNIQHTESNIHAGIYYLRQLYGKWDNSMPQHATAFMLASYNGGIGRVNTAHKRAGKPRVWSELQPHLPSETKSYVGLVQSAYIKRTRLDSR